MHKITINSLRLLLTSIFALCLTAVILLVGVNLILGKISSLNAEINSYKTTEAQLSSKLATLGSVDREVLNKTDLAYIAVPAENPAAVTLSQLRRLASLHELVITSVTLQGVDFSDEKLKTVTIEFKANGVYQNILAFEKDLEKLSPLASLESIKMDKYIGETADMISSIKVYYASLPERLPLISETVEGLSDDEVNLLTKIAELEQPQFSNLVPSSDSGRVNPFSIND